MELSDIRDEVERIVQDESYVGAVIDGYINKALQLAVEEISLRGMKTLDTVTTALATEYVTLAELSGGFSGRLIRVMDSDGNAVKIYPDLESLMASYPGLAEVGSVEAVALEGNTLWYQKIPAAEETLTVVYYRNATELVDDDDEPVDIPAHLQRKLLVNGAAWMIFDEIEDDVEGKKVNAQGHFWLSFNRDNKHSGVCELAVYAGKRRQHKMKNYWGV
jgi:hypothetical protein